jgi:hypothetical protein
MKRFTIDGGEELEERLEELCDRVRYEVAGRVGASRLEALVLGGGYGRGQGGVLRSGLKEAPYNDLEFYVFLRGSRLWNERRYRQALQELGGRLSPEAQVHIEFKIDSLRRLRRSAVSMFSYDLVARHRSLAGAKDLFEGCEQHLEAERIPLCEASRLLLNRCSGLLFAGQLLRRGSLSGEEKDFVFRNLAKAQLAFGDAVLAAFGQYHWSCLERERRLLRLKVRPLGGPVAHWKAICAQHTAGLDFKLHPRREDWPEERLEREFREVSTLARAVWFWLESRRLNRPFKSVPEYVEESIRKCPHSGLTRNVFLNYRTFGAGGVRMPLAGRYPRERLFNALPLLLWEEVGFAQQETLHFLQRQLHSDACDRTSLVGAYKDLWALYG